jgi:hypothetical protein
MIDAKVQVRISGEEQERKSDDEIKKRRPAVPGGWMFDARMKRSIINVECFKISGAACGVITKHLDIEDALTLLTSPLPPTIYSL